MLICLGDIHINSRRDPEFEKTRIEELSKCINPEGNYIALLGDTFDRNDPSPLDYLLFYNMVEAWSSAKAIYIIAGNHDYKVITNLYAPNLSIILEPTYINELDAYFVPWTHLNSLHSLKGNLLLSHIRCSIPPFIKEEFPLAGVSGNFNTIILGDIHTPYSPYPNIYYTTSPSQLDYVIDNPEHGYIEYDGSINRIILDLPKREKIKLELGELPPVEVDHRNRYKYIIPIKGSEAKSIKRKLLPNQIVEFVHITEQVEEADDRLRDFIEAKLSVEDILFSSTEADQSILNDIRRRIH